MPGGYGLADTTDGVLDWSEVEARLTQSLHYWMATTRQNGSPHAVPRWGVWLDNRFWYDGALDTVHARNLAQNSACVLHLEDGRESVIVEGSSGPADPPGPAFGSRLSEAFCAKYTEFGYSPGPDSWEGEDAGGLTVLTPSKAMAWFDFPADATRFTF